ncbi:thioredoxin family protein [Candidatus Saccharibacteria bacterium]|nr:thioredoxin family protein [Candidatus Saccharibacteria bacterium]
MKKPYIVALIVAAVILIGGGVFALTQENASTPTNKTANSPAESPAQSTNTSATNTKPANTTAGRYEQYSSGAVSDASYDTTVVFFYAPWCPECRAFKQAITDGQIPDGVQVLEADFDSSTDLKKKYGVTLQSTFVRVNTSGDLQQKWVGYGKDKSLSSVLENVQ